MSRNLPVVAAAILVLVCGVVHGLWNERWGTGGAVDDAVALLGNVPRDVGDWRGTDLELSPEEVRAARIAGYCYRRYENARNRHAVVMLLVCGRPGPIAVHTPDVCFEGAGYKRVTSPSPFALAYAAEGREGTFRTMRLRQEEAAFPTELRVFWSWHAGGAWQAPDQPRLSLARHRALYKLYILRSTNDEEVRPEDDPCVAFMRLLLPRLDSALSGP